MDIAILLNRDGASLELRQAASLVRDSVRFPCVFIACRRARASVLLIFFVHGAVFSTWISRIPAIQSGLRLSTGTLGLALLGIAAGSVLAMPMAGWMISRIRLRRVTAISSLWFALALVCPSLASSAMTLGWSLALIGLGAGAMDVAMNAQGVEVERMARQPLMAGFHAAFSFGGMAGAAAGGAVAKAGVDVRVHFLLASLIFLGAVVAALPGLLPAQTGAIRARRRFRLTPSILGLGAICFCFFLSEGAVADWSALYLMRILRAGPAQAAAAYALFRARWP